MSDPLYVRYVMDVSVTGRSGYRWTRPDTVQVLPGVGDWVELWPNGPHGEIKSRTWIPDLVEVQLQLHAWVHDGDPRNGENLRRQGRWVPE